MNLERHRNIKTMEENSEKSSTTTSQDTRSISKDKFVKAGQSSVVSLLEKKSLHKLVLTYDATLSVDWREAQSD